MGQTGPAMENAQRAIDFDPRLPAAWTARARVLRAMNRPADALADYQRALGYQPQDRTIPVEIAEVYGQLHQPQRALATLQALAERYSPGEEPQRVLYLEGLAQMALGRFDEAVESLSAAATRERPTPEILCRLAEARLAAGRPKRRRPRPETPWPSIPRTSPAATAQAPGTGPTAGQARKPVGVDSRHNGTLRSRDGPWPQIARAVASPPAGLFCRIEGL